MFVVDIGRQLDGLVRLALFKHRILYRFTETSRSAGVRISLFGFYVEVGCILV